MKEFDIFILKENINPVLKISMRGVILDIYDSKYIEAEFVKPDGTNWVYKNLSTFTIPIMAIELVNENK